MARFNIFRTGLGVGDVLLSTGILRAWQRQHKRLVFVESRFPELFYGNPDVWRVMVSDSREKMIHRLFGHRGIWRVGSALNRFFEHHILKPTYPFPCHGKHLMDAMAEAVGVTLKPDERHPFLYLSSQERQDQSWASGWIAVQSSSTNYWTVNKHWVPGRMQQVVNHLVSMGFSFVHLGSLEDEPLHDVKDLRGKTSLREAAAILANTRFFIGLEGGLVHLARAVETRSVVVYTEYTLPEETGYPENINLRDPLAGPGCWKREHCEHCTSSADHVISEMVVWAIEKVL